MKYVVSVNRHWLHNFVSIKANIDAIVWREFVAELERLPTVRICMYRQSHVCMFHPATVCVVPAVTSSGIRNIPAGFYMGRTDLFSI